MAQVAGVYRRRFGDALVTVLSDGYLDAPLDIVQGMTPEAATRVFEESFRPPAPRISVNVFAVEVGGRTALIDTGSGNSMGPTLGWLPQSLEAAGIAAADIDTILLSHMHPDHSNGLTAEDGTRLFPNAEIVVDENEVRHWHDDAAMARATDRQKERYFRAGRFQIAPYRDRLRHAAGEVFPHVTAMPIPGHTPGHTAYLIESGGEAVLIWGDTVHIPELQLRDPAVTMVFDSDPDAAVASRRRVLDMVASERLLAGGLHLHFPGFGHVERRGEGYGYVPESWAFTV